MICETTMQKGSHADSSGRANQSVICDLSQVEICGKKIYKENMKNMQRYTGCFVAMTYSLKQQNQSVCCRSKTPQLNLVE